MSQLWPGPLDVVELTVQRPGGPAKGSVGTIVEELPGDTYLVEFCDEDGRTITVETVLAQDLFLRR